MPRLHPGVCLALHASGRLEVMVANPRAVKAFGQALLARNKTEEGAHVLEVQASAIDAAHSAASSAIKVPIGGPLDVTCTVPRAP